MHMHMHMCMCMHMCMHMYGQPPQAELQGRTARIPKLTHPKPKPKQPAGTSPQATIPQVPHEASPRITACSDCGDSILTFRFHEHTYQTQTGDRLA